ncbi:MAG: hypothetical protein R2834_07250 [Rhodothermales bacterium]
MADLQVARSGWDSVRVTPVFAERTRMRGDEPVAPDSVVVFMLDAAYDTLYAGPNVPLYIPDADLGSEERILIDVCGTVQDFLVCEQASVLASPKRVQITPDLTYPLEQDVQRGTYELPIVLERQVYDTENWEPIRPKRSLRGRLKAYVEGRENEPVQVAFAREKGSFDLGRDANYRDFKFALDSELRNRQSATIRFDVYLDLAGIDGAIASLSRAVRVKTNDERQTEVGQLAERAADRIIEIIDPFVDDRKSVAYVDTWQFNAIRGMYTVEMEVSWSSTTFVRSAYRIRGTLEVAEDGSSGSFKLADGDRNGLRRWQSRVSGDRIDIGALSVDRVPVIDAGLYDAVEGLLIIEAEHFDANEPARGQLWQKRTDIAGYQGEGAMVALPDHRRVIEAPDRHGSPELVYGVRFDRAGTYYVWLRVWAEGTDDNSVHVGLDGVAQRSALRIETQRYDRWQWTGDVRGRRSAAMLDVDRPGMHTLHLWMREDGLYVDQILLTTDPRFEPEDRGYLESGRVEPEDQTVEAAVVPSFNGRR